MNSSFYLFLGDLYFFFRDLKLMEDRIEKGIGELIKIFNW